MASATLSLFEIPAGDSRKLADFFRVVFGWDAVEVPWSGPRYLRLLSPAGAAPPGGGILERGAGGEAFVDRLTVVIRVEGEPLEAVMARVEAAGGVSLRAPSAVGSSGRYARFLDPEGNSFGLWSDGET